MTGKILENITEDEAELYDRQIRLWGLDAQKRLRASQVLVIGADGLAAEVCKNIVLAGVKSLVLNDPKQLSELDTTSQFLAPQSKLGTNRALASVPRLQELNPMVDVVGDETSIDDKPDEYFARFDVICATGCTREQLLRLDFVCRQNDVKFFAGDVFGYFGFMFADLQEHEFAEEVNQTAASSNDGEPAKKKPRLNDTKRTVKRTVTFPPLQDALDVDWSAEPYSKRLKRTTSTHFIIQVLLAFRSAHHRNPLPSLREQDSKELKKLKDVVLQKQQIPNYDLSDDFIERCFGQLCPASAIVGGILAQEVIKAVSQQDRPHNNFFYLNILNDTGVVESIGN